MLGFDPNTHQRQLSKRMGVMLQEGGIYPGSGVLETVRHYARLYGNGADATALVEAVGLTDRSKATWKRLSGGERQRLSLALALAAKPDVAFLDEPTSGIDINGRDAVRGIIRELASNGCAVVLATHELDEAERLADRMVIIDHGSLIADGTLADLRRGHDEIRFRSDPDLDLRRLAADTGIVASRVGNDEYVIDAPPQPRLMAQLGGWLAEGGHPLARSASRRAASGRRVPSSHRRRRRRIVRLVLVQLRVEVRRIAGNGEQLLLTLGIPVLLLVFFSIVDVLPTGTKEPIDFLAPGILALATMSTAMVSLGIGTGFERSYHVLKRLGATPLGDRA